MLSQAIFIGNIVVEAGLEDLKGDLESAEQEGECLVPNLRLLHPQQVQKASMLVPIRFLEGLTAHAEDSLAEEAQSRRADRVEKLKYVAERANGDVVLHIVN